MAVGNILNQDNGVQSVNGTSPDYNGNVNIPLENWEALKKWNLDVNHPIGSYYISDNAQSPQTLFGGTWEKIEGKFLLGSSSSYPVKSTGGEAEHTLTIKEMPSHTHKGRITAERVSGTTELTTGAEPTNYWKPGTPLDPTGGGLPHNNMPPYRATNVWVRTA